MRMAITSRLSREIKQRSSYSWLWLGQLWAQAIAALELSAASPCFWEASWAGILFCDQSGIWQNAEPK